MAARRTDGLLQALVLLIGLALLAGWLTADNASTLALPPVDASIVPQPGRWVGTAFKSVGDEPPPMQLLMDVDETGAVRGTLALYPLYVPENAINLVATNGCKVEFGALGGHAEPIGGVFTNAETAIVQVDVTACQVKFFGPVDLNRRVRGQYRVRYNATATEALRAAAERQLTPLEVGKGIFVNSCSACHGNFGQGAPGIPSLLTPEVRQRSDEQLLTIINLGVPTTGMPAWGSVLTDEEKVGVLAVLRNMDVLRD